MRRLPHSWFADDAVVLAPKLLGKIIRKGSCYGIIVETEAYSPHNEIDAQKITQQNALMRDTYGHWYVRFTYGMHHCVNITTNKDGVGSVLIRAVEPTKGIEIMKENRNIVDECNLTNGPAKFCKAFDIDRSDNGNMCGKEFTIYDTSNIQNKQIIISTRIGISHDIDLPWRFYIRDNPFVSGVRPK